MDDNNNEGVGYDAESDEVESVDWAVSDHDEDELQEFQDHPVAGANAPDFNDVDVASEVQFGDAEEGDGDGIDDEENENNEGGACNESCRQATRQLHATHQMAVAELEDDIAGLESDITRLQADIARLQLRLLPKKPRRTREWRENLESFFDTGNPGYETIYTLSCKEENMSSVLHNIHPNLRLRPPHERERRDGIINPPNEENLHAALQVMNLEGPNAGPAWILRGQPGHPGHPGQPAPSTFPFDSLAGDIQVKIFKIVCLEEGKLIHAISRLDPYEAPDRDEVRRTRTGLLHRFHVSGSSCNITYAKKPNDMLQYLLVCKRWLFIGVHAFYGLNTFAFSSFGELDRFYRGIGEARAARLQHVELLWIGSQYITKPGTSNRTWALSCFCEMPRLRTLVVHVNETSQDYLRRRWEAGKEDRKRPGMKYMQYMTFYTKGQPNHRMTRSLRTLQGLDFIYQLRGMKYVQFYDFQKHLDSSRRVEIRDWSFVEDVERVVTMPKRGEQAEIAEIENLHSLTGGFDPTDVDFRIVKKFYEVVDGLPGLLGVAEPGVDESEDGSGDEGDDGNVDGDDSDSDDNVDENENDDASSNETSSLDGNEVDGNNSDGSLTDDENDNSSDASSDAGDSDDNPVEVVDLTDEVDVAGSSPATPINVGEDEEREEQAAANRPDPIADAAEEDGEEGMFVPGPLPPRLKLEGGRESTRESTGFTERLNRTLDKLKIRQSLTNMNNANTVDLTDGSVAGTSTSKPSGLGPSPKRFGSDESDSPFKRPRLQ